MYYYCSTFFTLYDPHHQLLHRVSKPGVRLEALLKALVMVFLRALPDVSNWREGRQWKVVAAVETRLIVALFTGCAEEREKEEEIMCRYIVRTMYMYICLL